MPRDEAARQRRKRATRRERLADAPHGTDGGYTNWGCRQECCRTAHAEAQAIWRRSSTLHHCD